MQRSYTTANIKFPITLCTPMAGGEGAPHILWVDRRAIRIGINVQVVGIRNERNFQNVDIRNCTKLQDFGKSNVADFREGGVTHNVG